MSNISQDEETPLVQRSLDLVFHALLPKDKIFYPLFDQAAANMVETAAKLEIALKADPVARLRAIQEIEKLENKGDDITHAIFNEAMTTFLVPFDREDVQSLAMAIDDVVDYLHGTAKRIELYKIHQIPPAFIQIAEITTKAARELQQAIIKMRSLRNKPAVRLHLDKIKALETQADNVMKDCIAQLFKQETDAIYILKIQEVIIFMENATDKCEDAATVIEGVIVKYS